MFLFEKYTPNKLSDFVYNRDVCERLLHMSTYDDIPNIMLSGPAGSCKKTLVKIMLEHIFGDDINDLKKVPYKIEGIAKKEIEILQSRHHIVIEPTSSNSDKNIFQKIIKKYLRYKTMNFFSTSRSFKIVVIHSVELLSPYIQAALRRAMEIYSRQCRFLFTCNNSSKIIDPIKSRCMIMCTSLPSIKNNDIYNIIHNIALRENIDISADDLKNISTYSYNNLKKAIWMLNCKKLECDPRIVLDDTFEKVVDLIFSCKTNNNYSEILINLRVNIYDIIITNIKGSEIIITILDKILTRIDNDMVYFKIVSYAAKYEYNLVHGRRDILNIDPFLIGIMKQLLTCNNL